MTRRIHELYDEGIIHTHTHQTKCIQMYYRGILLPTRRFISKRVLFRRTHRIAAIRL